MGRKSELNECLVLGFKKKVKRSLKSLLCWGYYARLKEIEEFYSILEFEVFELMNKYVYLRSFIVLIGMFKLIS